MAEADDSATASAAPANVAVDHALSTTGMPVLRLGTYEGPLDLLLDLARAQRVDFATLSMLALAQQFVAAVEGAIAGRKVPLGQMGDWLVAAATLLALRARLLLPADALERRDADREAAALRRQLAERAAVQRLADWLEQRPQLGQEVFGRGMIEPEESGPPAADITELLRACLRLLEQPLREAPYQPRLLPLWRVPAALAHIRGLLTNWPPEGLTLAELAPAPEQGGASPLQRRAALASTLMAGLELALEGELRIDQKADYQEVLMSPPLNIHPTFCGPHPNRLTTDTMDGSGRGCS